MQKPNKKDGSIERKGEETYETAKRVTPGRRATISLRCFPSRIRTTEKGSERERESETLEDEEGKGIDRFYIALEDSLTRRGFQERRVCEWGKGKRCVVYI